MNSGGATKAAKKKNPGKAVQQEQQQFCYCEFDQMPNAMVTPLSSPEWKIARACTVVLFVRPQTYISSIWCIIQNQKVPLKKNVLFSNKVASYFFSF
jgi:hypothetical protein